MAQRSATHPHLTKIIGRKHDLTSLASLLTNPDIHLVTICGTGGIGKTRLALEVVDLVQDDFDDGVVVIDLVPVKDAALIPEQILSALNMPFPETDSVDESVIQLLEDQHLLLILDNMEHLLSSRSFLTSLLERCPDIAILATSRERLGIPGEHVLEISPLSVPDQHGPQTVDVIAGSDAVQLFLERARAADRAYELTIDNSSDVAAICRRLDGLPLAIELAAARIADIPPRLILRNFARILPFLERQADDPDGRHRTMLNAIAWSYGSLSEREREVFSKLSVFQSGFTIEDATAVAGLSTASVAEMDIIATLASLTNKHLLVRRDWQSDEPRYDMLQTMREFGLEQLVASNLEQNARDAHAQYLIDLANELRFALRGPSPGPALERFVEELDEFRSALAWLIQSRPFGDIAALTLCNNLANFWLWRGHAREGIKWYQAAFAQAGDDEHSIEHARAYLQLGHFTHDNYLAAFEYYQRSLNIFERLDHKLGTAGLHSCLGMSAQKLGSYPDAERHLTQSLRLFEELEDDTGIATASFHLGTLAGIRADFQEAKLQLDRARSSWDRAGDRANAIMATYEMGRIHRIEGRYRESDQLLRWSLSRLQDAGIETVVSSVHTELGLVTFALGDLSTALHEFRTALQLGLDSSLTDHVALAIFGISEIAISAGNSQSAAELLAGALHWLDSTGYTRTPDEDALAENALQKTKLSLDEESFSVMWSRGLLLSPEDACLMALNLELTPATPEITSAAPAPSIINSYQLTKQERTILCLIARGLTNKGIADELFISSRTVAVHVQSILRKLDAENRTHASALAYLAGICEPAA